MIQSQDYPSQFSPNQISLSQFCPVQSSTYINTYLNGQIFWTKIPQTFSLRRTYVRNVFKGFSKVAQGLTSLGQLIYDLILLGQFVECEVSWVRLCQVMLLFEHQEYGARYMANIVWLGQVSIGWVFVKMVKGLCVFLKILYCLP